MTKLNAVILVLIAAGSLCGQERILPAYTHPIPYQPLHYVCYYTQVPPAIDGFLDEGWEKASWSAAFGDIQGSLKPNPPFLTRFKLLWDSSYLYVGLYLQESDLWATLVQRDTVIFYDNDIEVFIDPDGDSHYYFEIELNALGTLWDLLLVRPYRDMQMNGVFNGWDVRPMRWGVKLFGTLNHNTDQDSAWTVEMAIPLTNLAEGNEQHKIPQEGDRWRMNFSRVQHTLLKSGLSYLRQTDQQGKPLPENNWTWSPQGRINMHEPEHWGFVQFTKHLVGAEQVNFVPDPDLALIWFLRQIYYQQKEHRTRYARYATELKVLNLPEPPGGTDLTWEVGTRQYLVTAKSYDTGLTWHLRQDGRIWKAPGN